ncbi:hypothetical protein [Planktothricoides raciborskii]|uniref:Uncharacterized protein n=2 Tax=Planktothricoides raciborskii TaxID=132608 RepID=A0AAU8JCV1_9CYAN|nr:hypothetical protein [Planktothricoides raciborskii]MBD2542341.1 hypothetical protein [Planktothricoides raciborskii FACHB-1370]MBD2582009.1 hypothetical protein [Planktothricoides raciborskii FACHB-1261]
MSVKITFSSELMQNYKQAEIVAPDTQFEALQTNEGHSLLFSIGTNNVFYLTKELVDHATGWQKTDLSSTLSQYHNGLPVVAKTFAVSQSINNDNVDIALAITVDGQDYLYLAQNNSNSDMSWSQKVNWLIMPFDDKNHSFSNIEINDIYIAQVHNGEYIVVDIIKNPDDSQKFVFRYYIDPTQRITGQIWNAHDLPANLEPDQIKSCLGKRSRERVEGIYTLGDIDNKLELIYTPLYNPFNPRVPANPVRLVTPPSASAIAVGAAADSNFTDLFVAGDKALYYFPYDRQQDGKEGIKVFENDIFLDVQKLFVHTTDSKVIVWGVNRAQEIFYTTCNKADIKNSSAWSYPLALLNGVEQVTPYVNCVNDGNTFFAHVGGNQLKKAVQSPETTIWKYNDILLPSLYRDAKSLKFNSYTTRIHVADDKNAPIYRAKIKICSLDSCSVYINNRYYILDKEPIEITSDSMGGITIVEKVSSLKGSCFKIYGNDGHAISINPMDKPRKKVEQLDSIEKLNNAKIEYGAIDSTPKSLISSSTSDADKQAVVDSIKQLATVSQSLPADGSVKTATPTTTSSLSAVPHNQIFALAVQPNSFNAFAGGNAVALPAHNFPTSNGFSDFTSAIEVVAGDFISFWENIWEFGKEVFHVFIVAAEDAWHFIAKIGEKAYRFVIDCAEKVAHAFELVFNAIKTFIGDLIDYLKFLFDWEDFVRTKDVFKKLLLLYFDHVLDGIEGFKTDFNGFITEAKNTVDDWAGIKHDDWQPSVQNSSHPLGYLQAITDIEEVFTSPAMFLFQHFVHNAPNSQSQGSSNAAVDVIDDLLNRTIQALEDEGNVLIDAVNRIQFELIGNSQYESLSLSDVLKKLTAIVVDALLNSTEDLVDILIDVFVILAGAVIKALDTPIWIPVLSDILEDVGITISFSMLDVIMMIGAVPATLVYKGIKGSAPFSSGDGFSDKILAAKDLDSLRTAFASSSTGGGSGGIHSVAPYEIQSMMLHEIQPMMSIAAVSADGSGKEESSLVPIDLPKNAKDPIFLIGHLLGGVVAMLTSVLAVADALSDEGSSEYETAVGISGAVGAMSAGLATVLAQPYPIQNAVMSKISSVSTGATLLGKVAFYAAPKAIAKKRGITDAGEIQSLTTKTKKIGTGFDATIAVLALLPTCYHFSELSSYPASRNRTEAILDETSNICNYLNRICAFAVRMDEEPKSKAILAGVMGVLIALYGGLQISESIIEATGGLNG